jgi:hypothetical protein
MKREPIYIDPAKQQDPEPPYTGKLPWVTFRTRDPLGKRIKTFFASEASSGLLGVLLAVPVIVTAFGVVMLMFCRRQVEQAYGHVLWLSSVPGALLIPAIFGFERPFVEHKPHQSDQYVYHANHRCKPPKKGKLGSKWICSTCGGRWRVPDIVSSIDPITEPIQVCEDPITEPIPVIDLGDADTEPIIWWPTVELWYDLPDMVGVDA